MDPELPPILLVDWLDACFDTDEPPEPLLLHSVGWLVEADERRTIVAMEHHEGKFRDFLCIPAAYIVSIQEMHFSPPGELEDAVS